jgi:hypothetical protein
MNEFAVAIVVAAGVLGSSAMAAPVGGQQGEPKVGITVAEMNQIAGGWSASKDILGKPVYNDKGEKVGSVDDVILSSDKTMTAAIVGTGGFVGLAKHDVAIRMDQLQMGADKKLTLPGATKDALKQLPEYVIR